ncbi:MAG: substrate-binding domain-containing protein, partial [Pseudomonadota bacterium]
RVAPVPWFLCQCRLQRVAKEIGYVPDRAGVRLRTGRTHVIALALWTEADVLNLTARLINSIATALRHTSYHLNIMPCMSDEDIMLPIRHIVETRAADAIIMNQIRPEDPRVSYLMERGFPFATHGRTTWSKDHAFYDYDNHAFAQSAVELMLSRGRSNLALLAPPADQSYSMEMIKGFSAAATAAGATFEVIKNLTSDDHNSKIVDYFREFRGPDPRFDGLVFGSANACMAAAAGLEQGGYTLGKDVDVTTKEAIPFLGQFRPAILTYAEDAWAAGDFLARAAIKRIEQPDEAPMQFLEQPVAHPAPNRS